MTVRSPFDLRSAVAGMIADQARAGDPVVLLVGGPGCAGKSTFAAHLAQVLTEAGLPTAVLDLDCYLIERAKRVTERGAIGGYNPAGYLLADAGRDIETLCAGRAVTVSPYDKVTSTRAPPIEIRPADHLIIEGSMGLCDPIYRFGTLSLFLDAPQEVLYANRKRRELGMGMTVEQIDRKFELLQPDYTAFIRPQRRRAQLCVEVDERYEFLSLTLGPG